MVPETLKTFLLPPLLCLIVTLAGLLLRRRRPRTSRALIALGLGLLWLLSTPAVAAILVGSLQGQPALDPEEIPTEGQAIVVLGAGLDRSAREYAGMSVGPYTLVRLRYAAFLQRKTGLPVMVCGGKISGQDDSAAEAMARVLENEFDVPVRWREERSRNTFENARFAAELLAKETVQRILVVTHAWHMPRALQAFGHTDLEVIPAPTAFRSGFRPRLGEFLPSWKGLRDNSLALHEWLGRLWYAVAY